MREKNKSYQIRVLIISDRLQSQAMALAKYLRDAGSIDVLGIAESRQQALEIAQEHSFDYLIIAGYLRVEHTYDVIAELQREGKKFLTVQWAILDSLISDFCQRYRISLQFERTRPMADFVKFLDSHSEIDCQ